MKLYTQGAVAKELNVSLRTVWRWCQANKIKTTIYSIVQANGREIQYPYISEKNFQSFVNAKAKLT